MSFCRLPFSLTFFSPNHLLMSSLELTLALFHNVQFQKVYAYPI